LGDRRPLDQRHSIGLYSHNNNQAKTPSIYLARSNGTQAAPTAVTYTCYECNPLGGFLVSGYDGSVYSNPGGAGGGGLICYTDENWTTSAHGSHCSLYATVVGNSAAQEFLAIGGKDAAGNGSGIRIVAYRSIAFSGLTNSNPMIVPGSSPATISFKAADDSAFIPIISKTSQLTAGNLAAAGTCNSGAEGTVAVVTNSDVTTWGSTITGASSNRVLAYCNGTNWTVAAK
jgi:hypothetical protein